MSIQDFSELVGKIALQLGGKPLDEALEVDLNAHFPASGAEFLALKALCAKGEAEGWLVAREMDGIRFGRPIKPGGVAGRFSVDVVRMKDIRGPHHIHTTGEIGAILSIDGDPRFDGKREGWYVYGPGSDHHPTVAGGDAYVLYLLPEGAIEFTGR
ncbi:MAG TPA: DUF4863 family protein [Rhabdaerophilum sp.]|nr:DUF4863 family protein [Rhabdaerophilum sp.]